MSAFQSIVHSTPHKDISSHQDSWWNIIFFTSSFFYQRTHTGASPEGTHSPATTLPQHKHSNLALLVYTRQR
ncbi:MAG TPA: hypothetical protein DCE42_04015 [Myxococcales bacterium]|nr:hypothetical protein [Deltaproteobacteria bacterium]HAA53892.1 hypothetical protein [Myxococcales bacterium]